MSLNETVNHPGIAAWPPSATTRLRTASNSTSTCAVAFANYRLTPSAVIITHTETPARCVAAGIASELVRGCARTDPRRRPQGHRRCGFVVDYLRRNPQFFPI
jgi:predicted GNAT family acetyltransferase